MMYIPTTIEEVAAMKHTQRLQTFMDAPPECYFVRVLMADYSLYRAATIARIVYKDRDIKGVVDDLVMV